MDRVPRKRITAYDSLQPDGATSHKNLILISEKTGVHGIFDAKGDEWNGYNTADIAVEQVLAYYNKKGDGYFPASIAKAALLEANEAILDWRRQLGKQAMGATIGATASILQVKEDRVAYGHIGGGAIFHVWEDERGIFRKSRVQHFERLTLPEYNDAGKVRMLGRAASIDIPQRGTVKYGSSRDRFAIVCDGVAGTPKLGVQLSNREVFDAIDFDHNTYAARQQLLGIGANPDDDRSVIVIDIQWPDEYEDSE